MQKEPSRFDTRLINKICLVLIITSITGVVLSKGVLCPIFGVLFIVSYAGWMRTFQGKKCNEFADVELPIASSKSAGVSWNEQTYNPMYSYLPYNIYNSDK